MMPKKQTYKFSEEQFTHTYNPVRWNDGKTVYFPGKETNEAKTAIDTVVGLSEPSPHGFNWNETKFLVRFDLDESGSRIEGYAPMTSLRKTQDYVRLDDEIGEQLSEAFPGKNVSLEVTIHTQKSQYDDIFLLANEIYGSLALNTARKAIEKVKRGYESE